jgi:hypothetical protein
MYQQPSGPAEEPRRAANDVQPLSERQSKDTEELEEEEEEEAQRSKTHSTKERARKRDGK